MEPKNHPLQKGTSSSSHHVSRFQPLIFQGVFASFWMMIFTLTKRICWYQMRMEKNIQKISPQSAQNLTPQLFDSSLVRQVIDVSSVPMVAFATPLITLQLRDQVGHDRKIWWFSPNKNRGFPYVFHPKNRWENSLVFFLNLERLERLEWMLIFGLFGLVGWRIEAILGGGFKDFFIFIPTWGRFPIWLIFFKGVETTNKIFLLRVLPF